ncbi:MAG: 2-amino-4-hydroxy-6-hydroxymethyldihydropteridine diphosphokinase [Rhodospirillales bacterium]|nr:2-amino-4-hydroxy-6-hydroxymethyldihydropteridine diphosphokinase [Rhodospirillales bacterium]
MSPDLPQIFVAIGANLASPRFGTPPGSFAAALRLLGADGVEIVRVSRWYRSPPLPPSAQPHYINGVIAVRSGHAPEDLLSRLHRVEGAFGRVRGERNAARSLDLDLLAYGDAVIAGGAGGLEVPHPRLSERAFVLLPWAELSPAWRHPLSGLTVAEMIARLPPGQEIEVLGR